MLINWPVLVELHELADPKCHFESSTNSWVLGVAPINCILGLTWAGIHFQIDTHEKGWFRVLLSNALIFQAVSSFL